MLLSLGVIYKHKKTGGLYHIIEQVKSKIEGIDEDIIIYESRINYVRCARTVSDFQSSFEDTNMFLL